MWYRYSIVRKLNLRTICDLIVSHINQALIIPIEQLNTKRLHSFININLLWNKPIIRINNFINCAEDSINHIAGFIWIVFKSRSQLNNFNICDDWSVVIKQWEQEIYGGQKDGTNKRQSKESLVTSLDRALSIHIEIEASDSWPSSNFVDEIYT